MSRIIKRRITKRPIKSHNNNDSAADPDEIIPAKRPNTRSLFEMNLPKRAKILGRALVCGQGDTGQLGLGDDDSKFERKRPALIDSIDNVVDVCAGGMHNLLLTNDGYLYSFGCNDEGALGRDSSEEGSEFLPKQVDLPVKILKISAGDSHSACLLEDGRVFAWGSFRNSHGNMGLSLEGNKRLPIDILPGVKCCDIASGADHLVILTCLGKVYTVGCAEQGQLGRISLRSASGESRRGKTEMLCPIEVIIIKRKNGIDAIWASNYCTFLRENDSGIIWAFGLNNYKQLGLTKEIGIVINPSIVMFKNVLQIAGGQHHTLLLDTNGKCFAIGRHDYGRLGVGKVSEDVTTLTAIKALEKLKIVSVACGEATSFALTDDGKLYSWGMGSNHQLGTGSEDDALEPVLIVSKQTQDKCVIRASGGGQHSIFLVTDKIPKVEERKAPTSVAAKSDEKVPTDNNDKLKASKDSAENGNKINSKEINRKNLKPDDVSAKATTSNGTVGAKPSGRLNSRL